MAKWYEKAARKAKNATKKVGNAALGSVTGGLLGDENFGFLDDVTGLNFDPTKDFGKLKSIGKDITGVTAAEKAAEAQRTALAEGRSSLERMFDKSMETQRPWLEAGARGLGQLEEGINSGRFNVDPGQFSYKDYQEPGAYEDPGQFGEFQFDFEADPGYKFRLEQGLKALEGSAAARGGLFSSNTGESIQDFAQGLASQEYADAYTRARDAYTEDRTDYNANRTFARGNYENDRNYGRDIYDLDRNFAYNSFIGDYDRRRNAATDDYNRLAGLSGSGQLSAGNMASQQMTQGGNLANIAQQQGNIGAQRAMAGYQGGMNLLNTGLQGLGIAFGNKP